MAVHALKIAFVIAQLDPARGGVERYASGLAAALARSGHDVTVFSEAFRDLPDAVHAERVGSGRGPRSTRPLRFDAAARERLGDLSRWDVVQGFGPTTVHTVHRAGGGTHGAYLRAMGRVWPVWRRGWERIRLRNRIRIETERRIYRDPALRCIANSEKTRREVCRDYAVPAERIEVIHNGVDVEAFSPERRVAARVAARDRFGLGPEAFALAFVGTGFARKGLRHAIEMLARLRALKAPGVLLVAGRGATAPWRRLASRLGVEYAVRFLGPVRDVLDVYAAADVFVLPSLYEPFGIAPLEALACGLPVLLSRDCGVSELLEDGREGRLLARPQDVGGGAAFLAALADDPAAREAYGARARRTARLQDLDAHAARVLEVYRSLSGQGGA